MSRPPEPCDARGSSSSAAGLAPRPPLRRLRPGAAHRRAAVLAALDDRLPRGAAGAPRRRREERPDRPAPRPPREGLAPPRHGRPRRRGRPVLRAPRDRLGRGEGRPGAKPALPEDGGRSGASTITQQLAKNLWLSPDRSWVRKGREAAIALTMELLLPKRTILEHYLSGIEWGERVYGLRGGGPEVLRGPRLGAHAAAGRVARGDDPGPTPLPAGTPAGTNGVPPGSSPAWRGRATSGRSFSMRPRTATRGKISAK